MISASNLTWDTKTSEPDTAAEYSDPWISAELTIADGFSHHSGLYLSQVTSSKSPASPVPPSSRTSNTWPPSPPSAPATATATTASPSPPWLPRTLSTSPGKPPPHYTSTARLAMNSTSPLYTDFLSRTNRVALPIPSSGSYLTNTTDWTATIPHNPDPQSPAGGVSSSANDLAKWLQLHLSLVINPETGERLVDEVRLNDTRTSQIVRGLSPQTNTTGFYGLGWNIDYDLFGRVFVNHAAAFSQGTRKQVKVNVEDWLGVVVLANCFPTGCPDGLVDYFFDVVYNRENGTNWIGFWNGLYGDLSVVGTTDSGRFEGEKPEGDGVGMLGVESYVGVYENDWVGRVRIEEGSGSENGQGSNGTEGMREAELVMTIQDSSNLSFLLTYWSRDMFVMYPVVQEPTQGTALTFTIGSDGNATGVTIEYFDGNGGGTLKRVDK